MKKSDQARLFVKMKWAWAKENNLFWFAVVLLILTGACLRHPGPIWGFGPPDFALRAWGMVLQLVGVLTVWHDLTTTGKAFGKNNWFKHTTQWLERGFSAPKASNSVSIIVGSANLVIRTPAPTIHAIKTKPSTEDRVSDLEKKSDEFKRELELLTSEIKLLENKINTHKESIKKIIDNNKNIMENKLEEVTSGNYIILSFGVVWLVIGMLLSTWAPELAKFIVGLQGNP